MSEPISTDAPTETERLELVSFANVLQAYGNGMFECGQFDIHDDATALEYGQLAAEAEELRNTVMRLYRAKVLA